MYSNGEKLALGALCVIAVPLVLFCLWALFFFMPVSMYTEAECLRNGYPKYAVSVGLERYCMNLDGSVTVKVDKAGEKEQGKKVGK